MNYIQLFIPEKSQKKVADDLKRHLSQSHNAKIKMKVKAAGGKIPLNEWSFNIIHNTLKMPAGIILSLKTPEIHE